MKILAVLPAAPGLTVVRGGNCKLDVSLQILGWAIDQEGSAHPLTVSGVIEDALGYQRADGSVCLHFGDYRSMADVYKPAEVAEAERLLDIITECLEAADRVDALNREAAMLKEGDPRLAEISHELASTIVRTRRRHETLEQS